jgi:hypothetical protein
LKKETTMGREVRRVPADWQHPKDEHGRYKPLFEGDRYETRRKDFEEKLAAEGMQAAIDWCGNPPNKEDYMPAWTEAEKTHLMMYEDTSEGTPISPAFKTPEELARWLADNEASSFGDMTASYEAWLNVARGGWAPSMVIDNGVVLSGVEDSIRR